MLSLRKYHYSSYRRTKYSHHIFIKSFNNLETLRYNSNRPKKVNQKQIVSHYFGFGNIKLDNLNATQNMNKTTGLDGSGKFGQKLHMKQK